MARRPRPGRRLTAYLVTGGTGFIGRYLLNELTRRRGAEVFVLVRPQSRAKLEPWGKKVIAVEGDIGKKGLAVSAADRKRVQGAEVFHLAAVYDLEAPEAANQLANVDGTRHVVQFANAIKAARLHHVSSIAVAGDAFKGEFGEDAFDAGQKLEHPYYRTKFEAEKIVREEAKVPIRVYRPAIVIGSSEDGQADRVDGIYYSFKIIQRLRDALPPWVPLIGVEGGRLNLVPVDFVARALAHIGAQPGLDGQTFHLVDPSPSSFGDTLNMFCRAAHAPQFTLRIDSRAGALLPGDLAAMLQSWKVFQTVKRQVLEGVSVPEAALSYASNRTRFTCRNAEAALEGSGIEVPPLQDYAWKIWDYYERHLDPQAPTAPTSGPPCATRSPSSPARRAGSAAPPRRRSPATGPRSSSSAAARTSWRSCGRRSRRRAERPRSTPATSPTWRRSTRWSPGS